VRNLGAPHGNWKVPRDFPMAGVWNATSTRVTPTYRGPMMARSGGNGWFFLSQLFPIVFGLEASTPLLWWCISGYMWNYVDIRGPQNRFSPKVHGTEIDTPCCVRTGPKRLEEETLFCFRTYGYVPLNGYRTLVVCWVFATYKQLLSMFNGFLPSGIPGQKIPKVGDKNSQRGQTSHKTWGQ